MYYNNKSFFDTINKTLDNISGVGVEEKARKEYRVAKRKILIITLILSAICGGILYFHFQGYNCIIPAVILAILDILSFILFILNY